MARGRKSKEAKEANVEAEEEAMQVDEAAGDGQAPETEAAPTILPDLTELKRDDDGGIHVGSNVYIPPPPPPALTFDSDKPRLIITHIENENFKSYLGKQTLGPFQKSFTSIVGPNGSGKSNVIDSMLFVFGYRAQKIRSKKISVLIHNSEGNQEITSCTVRVFFQEIIDKKKEGESAADCDDDYEVVPDSRFSVARTASRDNSSYYQIDSKRAQFKEVAKLLRAKGIDLDHNRFLILQGEVEQIALMKPKAAGEHDTGMLEFLEDIIGSSRFQEPIELLKNAHGVLDDQRTEKLNRVKLVEKEKDELEGPRNAALDYLRLENQIMTKKNTMYQHYKFRSKEKIEEVEAEKKEFEEKSKEVLEKVNKITEEKKNREEQTKEMNTALGKTRRQLDDAQEKFKKFDLEDTRMREELKSMNNRRKKLQHLAKQEKDKIEKLESLPEENKTKIEECHGLKEKLLAQVDEEQSNYDKAVETLNAETKVYQDEKSELETKMIPLKEDMNKKKSDLDIVQQELDLAKSKEEKEKTKLEQYRVQAEQEEAKLSSKKTRFDTVSGGRPEMERELNELNAKVGGLREREAKCLQEVRSMRSDFEEKRAKQTATKTMGQVHRAIMEQKACGNIPGVFGRLGDLGAIDKKYDVAISTAVGGSLDAILVDNPETARACIEFLRQNNVGRGNFFALDKATNQLKSRMKATGSFPENVPRLVDLIRPQDEKFMPAYYHFLRDTLVAENQQQSQRIAFGARRYRVVTLAGEIIEVSGAMSGGGRPISGKMGTQVSQADEVDGARLKKLEQDVHAAEETHRASAKAKTDCEERIRFLTNELQKSEREHQKLQLELGASTERLQGLKVQIKQQEKVLAQTKTDEKVLAELRKKEEALQKILDKSKEKVDDVKHQVKKLDATIKEIQSGKLKGITKRLEDTKTQLDKVKKEITRLEVGIKSAERDLKKATDKCESYENEIKETENKMREQTEKRKEVEAQCKEVIDELKGLKEKEQEQQAESKELLQMLEKLREKENKYKSKQIEINSEREKFDNEIAEQSKAISHWKRELKKLKLRDIPGNAEPEVLPEVPDEELKEVDEKQWQYELNLMEEKLGTMNVNYAIIEEYNRKEALYMDRVSELENITSKRDSHRKAHDELRKMRLNEFMEGFVIITGKLKEMYQMITLGGDAELELVDSLDPFTEGIVFSVRPPKKSWKSISNLSGGEKTLSSLALIFALHYYKPTPLYVMDEIDAALDFKNVSIVANYIKERTKNAQFIIISLRSNMFELADRLVGIYKTYNATKSVTINPGKLAAMGKSKVQVQENKESAA